MVRLNNASIGPRNFLRGNSHQLLAFLAWANLLQLGHGIFSVETSTGQDRRGAATPTLQLGHGIFSVETITQSTSILVQFLCFNWATEFSPWKQRNGRMGANLRLMLQLGHGIFSVETRKRSKKLPADGTASIGPRNFLRGNKKAAEGKTDDKASLQLGHGIFSVETAVS